MAVVRAGPSQAQQWKLPHPAYKMFLVCEPDTSPTDLVFVPRSHFS